MADIRFLIRDVLTECIDEALLQIKAIASLRVAQNIVAGGWPRRSGYEACLMYKSPDSGLPSFANASLLYWFEESGYIGLGAYLSTSEAIETELDLGFPQISVADEDQSAILVGELCRNATDQFVQYFKALQPAV